jgi:hypothetical protein
LFVCLFVCSFVRLFVSLSKIIIVLTEIIY